MVISIDDNLNSLYEELKGMGYEVHKLSEKINSDTVIYSEGLYNPTPVYSSLHSGNEKGIFLVNGDNKSFTEILNIINSRVYSSLF